MGAISQFLKKSDAFVAMISPRHDPMLMRVLVAFIAVICFAVDLWTGNQLIWLMGLPFYIICFLLYALGLAKSLYFMHRVSAELLIVTVMAVTLIDGQPLSGALVAWFIGLGLYISFEIIRKNREKIESLIHGGRQTARLVRGDEVREVPVADVREGAGVIVPKGEMVPVDGIITEGRTSLDESSVTGEPFPVLRVEGDTVTSGSVNLTAPVHIRATRDGDASFLSVISDEIESGLEKKSGLQRQAGVIVQIVLISATAYSFLLYFVTGNLGLMATALAVVCPCAWALATPTAFAAAIGRLASEKILAKGGEPLEALNEVKTAVFDKTGTLTYAEPEATGVVTFGMPEDELLEIASSVELRFSHPISRSIVTYAQKKGLSQSRNVRKAEDIPGLGVRSEVDGMEVVLGSSETMESLGITLPEVEYDGRAIWISVDSQLRGVIIIQDHVCSEMSGFGEEVRAAGISRVVLATGDSEEGEARRVAGIIGADEYRYNCKPADKSALVKSLAPEGGVMMVGDGVNDAPSLAAAHVGVAIGGNRNAGLAIKSSDIVILGDDAGAVLKLLETSRKMGRVIRENYAWGICFNIFGLSLATLGVLNPVTAAILHHVSSVFVVSNSARIYLFSGRRKE